MSKISGYVGYVAFTMALIATLSSLFLSEVLHWIPCELCWYQRICMYPLVVVIGVGVMRRDTNWPLTATILASIGWMISLYHSLLQWGVIPSTLAPCRDGVSCAVQEFDAWLGFITVPFMAFVAFTVIIVMSVIAWKGVSREQRV